MDDLSLGVEVLEAAHGAVVEAHADAHDDVGVIGGHIAEVVAVHAHEAVGERMVFRETGDAEEGRDHGNLGALGEGDQLVCGARLQGAVPAEDDGALGFVQDGGGAFDLDIGGDRDGVVSAEVHFVGIAVEIGFLNEDVLGDIDEHGAFATGRGDVEGFLDRGAISLARMTR